MRAVTGGYGSSRVVPFYAVAPLDALTERAGPGVTIRAADGSDMQSAVEVARTSDVALVFASDIEAEGQDRSGLTISGKLLFAVAAANPRTVVVLNVGGPVGFSVDGSIITSWVDAVPAIVQAWYPGEEDGHAIASVLFGDVNPSAKLPVTFPRSLDDAPANTLAQYPGVNDVADYSEGILVGY